MKKFSQLSVFRLQNEEAATLFKLSFEIAEPVSATIGELGLASFTAGKGDALPFYAQISQIQKSELTGQIISLRTDCNDIFAEIKRTTAYETKSRDNHNKDAANKLTFALKPYWDLHKKAISIQFEKTTEMITKVAGTAELKAAAIELNLDTIFTELETKNTALTKLYKDRILEVSSRDESSTSLRPEAQENYIHFCKVIELSLHFIPNQDLINLFNQLDELRVKYHAMLPTEETITDEEIEEVDTEV